MLRYLFLFCIKMEQVKIEAKFCSFCSEKDDNNSFETLDDYKRGTLEIVSRELNFFEPDILTCVKCTENLQQCFNFKSNCMENEDYLLNFVKDNGDRIDLNTVIGDFVQNDKPPELLQNTQKICRICFEPIVQESFVVLENFKGNTILSEMLSKCLPDMNLELTKCPVSCSKCVESLQNLYSFVQNCLNIQNSLLGGYSHVYLKTEIGEEHVKEEVYNDYNVEFTSETPENIRMEKDPLDVESFKSASEEMYYCDQCSYKHVKRKRIREHIKRVHEKHIMKIHQCRFCAYRTCDKSDMNTHSMIHKMGNMSKYHCINCDFKTDYRSSMIAHKKTHVDSLPYKCDVCPKRYIEKTQLDEHLLKNHKDEVDLDKIITSKIHECDVCGYRSTNSSHLTRHLVTHNKNTAEIFRCQICPYFCYDKHNFNAHSKKHTNPKPFSCAGCTKRVDRKQDLDSHILSKHCNDSELMKTITSKLYSCTLCCYRTVNKYHLTNHSKKHKL